MASPANNNASSSPPIPNRPNPKPRNSESGDPLRRSFGGNPFPANSRVNLPSDLSRRNSFGGRDNKENDVKAPKGSKHFMSPTISAVSKINASPRKKVLSDKNDLSRSENDVKGLILEEDTKQSNQLSCSEEAKGLILEDTKKSNQLSCSEEAKSLILEETKSHRSRSCVTFSDVTNIICIDEKNRFEEVSYDMTVTDFDEVEVTENKGVVYSDPRFRISPRPSVPYASPEFAGREIGPSLLPPYDPKKNYLSPRPQFLHYKPNPRVEQRFDECKQLDELFISESFSSDTEVSTEEEDDAVNEEESKDVGQLEVESDESEDAGQLEVEGDESEYAGQLEVESDEEMVCESIEETSQVPKQSGFRKLRFLGWFLALALGCMLVSTTFSPPTGSPFYEFHIPREITEFAKANNLEKLSDKLWTLTDSSLVYMDKLILRLGGREEKYGPLQFHNLTYTVEDYTVFQPTSVEIIVAELDHQELQLLQEKSNNLEEDGYVSEFEEESEEEANSEVVCETKDGDAETEMKSGTDIVLNEVEGNSEALLDASVERNTEEQSEPELNPEVSDDAGRCESQEMLEAVSSEKLEDFESEAIFIDQHKNVESGAIFIDQHKNVESGAIFIDQHKNVESGASINVALQKEIEVTDVESEAIYINHHDVESDASSINVEQQKENEVANVETESIEDYREISSETRDDDDVHPNKAVVVLTSVMLVLLAAVSFLFAKKAKPVAASAPRPAPETTKEVNLSHVPVENVVMKEKLSSLSFKVDEEVDDRTSSSSFQKKSSSQIKSRGGMSSRRESTATSASEYSIGSFSYGSFTTYEKIPIKSGDREEEMITPVRRSSRLRNNNQSSGL